MLFIVLLAAPSSILISSVPHYRQQSNTKLTSTSSAFRNHLLVLIARLVMSILQTWHTYVQLNKYCNFRLDGDCALLPRTLTHKYDNHALTLKYKPVGIISKEYYCEICEKDVNPRTWFYYCSSRDCDYSFHLSCICRDAQIIYQKVKIGAKIISRRHPCPLTTVLKREMKGGEVSSAVFVECKKCKFIGRTYGYFY